jgi:hypothetical protein
MEFCLEKKSRNQHNGFEFTRKWDNRKFVLSGQSLKYYKGNTLKGTIDTKNSTTCEVQSIEVDGKLFGFILTTEAGEKILFNAPDESVRRQCIDFFNKSATNESWEEIEDLVNACTHDNVQLLQALIEKDFDVDHRFPHGVTPLHIVAQNYAGNCMQILLKRSVADLNQPANGSKYQQYTPLAATVILSKDSSGVPSETKAKCVELLLCSGARMDIPFTLVEKGVVQPCVLFPYAHSILASEKGSGAVLDLLNKAAVRELMPQICDRFLRVLVRTKNLNLSLPLQGKMKQQIEGELLRVKLFPGFDEEENTIFVHSLVEVMANEAVLMIDDEGELEKGVFVSAASAWGRKEEEMRRKQNAPPPAPTITQIHHHHHHHQQAKGRVVATLCQRIISTTYAFVV